MTWLVGVRSGIPTPFYFTPKLMLLTVASLDACFLTQFMSDICRSWAGSELPASEIRAVYCVCAELVQHRRAGQICRIGTQKSRIPDWFCYNPGLITRSLNSIIISSITINRAVERIKWNHN